MSDVNEKRLAEEMARLDRIEAEGRELFKDPQLTLSDIAAIRQAAPTFGVSQLAAYRRAKELGLLSYQAPATPLSCLALEGREK